MSDVGRYIPLLSGPVPSPNSSHADIACRKCSKEFNKIFARARKCNHCSYSYCHSCSDYQALMPRNGPETGYDPMHVCSYCIEFLTITAAGRQQLKAMSLAKLKKYIAVYNIKIDRAVEEDDLVDAILGARGPNGCLPRANETFYRNYSVPNKVQLGRQRRLFSRQDQGPSANPPPAPPRLGPTQDFARPDLEPEPQSQYQPRPPPPRPATTRPLIQAPQPPQAPRDSEPRGRSQENPIIFTLPSGRTTSAQVMEVVSSAYDHCLPAITALIVQVHAHSGPNATAPSPDMSGLTAEVVELAGKLCVVAEALIQHPELPPGRIDDLESTLGGLYSSANSLIDSVRLLVFQPTSATSEVTLKQDVFRSATSVLKAGADCHSAIKYCLQQTVGAKPLIVDLPSRINVFDPSKAAQIPQESNTITQSRNKNSGNWSDPEPGDIRTNDVSSIYSYPSEQSRPVSMQDLDLVEHSYAAALASRLSAMSVYSVASSRTVSTDYGLYYTHWSGSQVFMMQGQSERDGLSMYL
ncbi:hypothetical protein GALMADRAFT_242382 [Galerina marginata CBS 339.88]|uniref:FYVE-type domain-containing protein n=1 Tax=Galerina marginata (strain CBS 339.88) TaxID=685588 RepID=A0A067TJN8_GALM3|nr:hypothetical protein GALMADRAFT_242382 [Galerina marginata CBS 339.88]